MKSMTKFRSQISQVDLAWSRLKRESEALLSLATTEAEEAKAIAILNSLEYSGASITQAYKEGETNYVA